MVGFAGRDPAAVDADLVVEDLEVLLQLGEPCEHLDAVGLEEGETVLLVAVAVGDELGVAPDGPDRHAGGPQPGADVDPVQVELLVAALAPPPRSWSTSAAGWPRSPGSRRRARGRTPTRAWLTRRRRPRST